MKTNNNSTVALKSPATLARFELFLNVFVRKPACVSRKRSHRKG
jgi:hypothetical protein